MHHGGDFHKMDALGRLMSHRGTFFGLFDFKGLHARIQHILTIMPCKLTHLWLMGRFCSLGLHPWLMTPLLSV
jgi:hypothetical protein